MTNPTQPAGWYSDGTTPGVERWFDGTAWTESTRPTTPNLPGAQPLGPSHANPKKGGKGKWIAGGITAAIVLIVIISVAAGGGSKKDNPSAAGTTSSASDVPAGATSAAPTTKAAATSKAPTGAAADVTITGCDTDTGFGNFAVAHVTVKNNSSKTSNYLITIAFNSLDGSVQYATGLASVDNLASGQSAQDDANTLKKLDQQFVCKVADVTRYAS